MAKGDRDRIHFRKETTAGGGKTLYARFIIPEKEPSGEIVWRRNERSTRTSDPKKAIKVAETFREEAFRRAYSNEPVKIQTRTFAQAIVSYIKGGGDKTYLEPILNLIGPEPLSDIDQDKINSVAADIYPGAKPATLNRQVYTPIIAVLRFAEGPNFRPPTIKRPKGWLPKSNFKKPPKDWWRRVIAACDDVPNLAALILFMRLHGRRINEACMITPADIDSETWTVAVRDTKTGQDISFQLSAPVIEYLSMCQWRHNEHVFGYASRWSVYKRLRKVCAKAGVPYHVPKDVGRHSFATALLESGKTLKEVAVGGRWASSKIPDMIYSHLEHNSIDDDIREIGEKWHKDQGEWGEVIKPRFGGSMGERK